MAVPITLCKRPLGMLCGDGNNTASSSILHENFDLLFLQEFKNRSKNNPCSFYSSVVTVMKIIGENHGSY